MTTPIGSIEFAGVDAFVGKAAQRTAKQCGKAHTFIAAIAVVILWGVSGPMFGFSETWHLVINTGTTIITFLMVFLIQNTQNRDTEALQLKLDELIRVSAEARHRLINLEDLTEDEMDRVKKDLTEAAARSRDAPDELAISDTLRQGGRSATSEVVVLFGQPRAEWWCAHGGDGSSERHVSEQRQIGSIGLVGRRMRFPGGWE